MYLYDFSDYFTEARKVPLNFPYVKLTSDTFQIFRRINPALGCMGDFSDTNAEAVPEHAQLFE